MNEKDEALLVEAYTIYQKQKTNPLKADDTRISELMEMLYPKKAFTAEGLQRDVLEPLNSLSAVIEEIRGRLTTELLRESVSIANEAEVAKSLNGFKLQLDEIREIARDSGFMVVLDSLNMKVEAMITAFNTYLMKSVELDELEREVLLRLKTKLK